MDIKDANKKLQNVEEKVDNIYCFCSKLIDRNYKTSRTIITVLILVIIVLYSTIVCCGYWKDDHVNNCSCEANSNQRI